MKKIISAVVLFALISCGDSGVQKNAFSKEALAEKLIALDGSSISFENILKKHKGKKIVLEGWASWCGDCVKAMPKLKQLQSDHADTEFVFISFDKTNEKWKEGIEKHSLEGDHYWVADGMKGSFGKSVDMDWIPRYIVVDQQGNVALYRAIETDFEKINATLKDLK